MDFAFFTEVRRCKTRARLPCASGLTPSYFQNAYFGISCPRHEHERVISDPIPRSLDVAGPFVHSRESLSARGCVFARKRRLTNLLFRCIRCSRSSFALAELESLDFAGRRFGKLIDEFNESRIFVRRECAFYKGL